MVLAERTKKKNSPRIAQVPINGIPAYMKYYFTFPISRLNQSHDIAIAALFEPFRAKPGRIRIDKSLHGIVHLRMIEMA